MNLYKLRIINKLILIIKNFYLYQVFTFSSQNGQNSNVKYNQSVINITPITD